jgi:hypothetical protein
MDLRKRVVDDVRTRLGTQCVHDQVTTTDDVAAAIHGLQLFALLFAEFQLRHPRRLLSARRVHGCLRDAEMFTASVTATAAHGVGGWHTMTTERIAADVKFAYLVPNVSSGLVTSYIEQPQVRYQASYGAEYEHESTGSTGSPILSSRWVSALLCKRPATQH